MPRSAAQAEAAERDGEYCVWSLYGATAGCLLPATDVHHLARRQPGSDLPELCISLAHSVHMAHHNGRSPTTSELLDLMLRRYGFDLRADFPRFFGGR